MEGRATIDRADSSAGAAPRFTIARPGLIWALDFGQESPRAIEDCDQGEGFRWLHLSLAHQGTIGWIARSEELPPTVRELLLATDNHQRALVDDGVVGCVLHDFERDFETLDGTRVGAMRFALTPTMMITARLHPIQSGDIVRQKLERGQSGMTAATALDMLVGTISETLAEVAREMSGAVQRAEDAFLDGHHPPTARDLIGIRRRLAQIHRMLDGMRAVFRRLEDDEDLPATLLATVEKLSQRLQAIDADSQSVLGQLRLLRDEIDIQAAQRTNQNLYLLSIMTALMLPATLVTGIFGMNTGGLLWTASPAGSLWATGLAIGTAGATYVLLRWLGFMRR
ncbi:zinc transporter [Sphingomonas sp. YR710]|uniref:transporter n=1 Tax=Sphingomonas sp. YR710 TaxID=1882773 RepID=UPI0008891CFA|nr:transporter [Sphingomonas sp. YR710]SDC86346.1 zinc transporter [Sphingomonas sp. YR710]